MDMSGYANTIISQFVQLSKCELEKTDGRVEKQIKCYFKTGRTKVFRGRSWDEVAFEMSGFMRNAYFKTLYIAPLKNKDKWIFNEY